jgi:hypothetical protein
MCPNYSKHLVTRQQAAAAYRAGQGGAAAAAGGAAMGLAVVPFTGIQQDIIAMDYIGKSELDCSGLIWEI